MQMKVLDLISAVTSWTCGVEMILEMVSRWGIAAQNDAGLSSRTKTRTTKTRMKESAKNRSAKTSVQRVKTRERMPRTNAKLKRNGRSGGTSGKKSRIRIRRKKRSAR